MDTYTHSGLQLAKQLNSREDTVGVIVTEIASRFSFWLLAFLHSPSKGDG